MNKYCLKRKAGSVSLLICLLSGIISALLLICYQSANLRAGEVRIIRAMNSTIDVNLAAYDKELKELYGLWGVKQKNITNHIFYEIIKPWQSDANLELNATEFTLSRFVLRDQIVSYMKLRAPAGLLNDYIYETQSYLDIDQLNYKMSAADRDSIPQSLLNMPHQLNSLQFSDIRDIQTYLQNNLLSYTPATLTVKAVRECLEWVLSPVFEPLEDALVKSVRSKLSDVIGNAIPVNPTDFGMNRNSYVTDLFNPVQISATAELVEKILAPAENQLLQRLLISEYALNTFSSAVPFKLVEGRKINHLTPGGISHDAFDQNRLYELEKIVTGEESTEEASDRIKTNLIITRFIIRLAQIISDSEKLQSYRPAANLLSTLITAASAGTVMIDPELLVWLIAVSDAIRLSDSDYNELIEGKPVSLWEKDGASYIEMYYHDYIRLFLLSLSEELLLERIGNQISQVIKGELVYEINATVNWRSLRCDLSAGY
jgi:hypothetical protein